MNHNLNTPNIVIRLVECHLGEKKGRKPMTEHTDKVDKARERIREEEWLKTSKALHANGGKLEVWLNDGTIEIYKKRFGKFRLIDKKRPPQTSPNERNGRD